MNVLLISDNNYAYLLGGCLYSLFKSNEAIREINGFIISDNISKESIEKIRSIGDEFKRNIIFLDPPKMNDKIIVKGSLNISTYYRLMLTSVIPKETEKILYLDCDILVRGSLNELWNTDISNSLLAGVYDTTGTYARTAIGLSKDDIYVNAGVLLINLKKWRQDRIEDRFLQYLGNMNWEVEFNDQGVINRICANQTKLLNPKYNFMPTYDRYTWHELKRIVNSENFYKEIDIKDSKTNPIIVHFAGYAFSRPWFENVETTYSTEYTACLNETGISFELKKQPSGIKYRIRKIVDKFPNPLCLVANKLIDRMYVMTGIPNKLNK